MVLWYPADRVCNAAQKASPWMKDQVSTFRRTYQAEITYFLFASLYAK